MLAGDVAAASESANAVATEIHQTAASDLSCSPTTDSSNASTNSSHPSTVVKADTLVFVDSAVDDLSVLRSGLDPNAELILLESDSDPIVQISDQLKHRQNVSAIHLVSHGSAGRLLFGDKVVDTQRLQAQAELIQRWRHSLTAQADILVYGCHAGEGEMGFALAKCLADLTGADVALSDDATGALPGSDWELERHIGTIEAPLAFNRHAQQTYRKTLEMNGPSSTFWLAVVDKSEDNVVSSITSPDVSNEVNQIKVPSDSNSQEVTVAIGTQVVAKNAAKVTASGKETATGLLKSVSTSGLAATTSGLTKASASGLVTQRVSGVATRLTNTAVADEELTAVPADAVPDASLATGAPLAEIQSPPPTPVGHRPTTLDASAAWVSVMYVRKQEVSANQFFDQVDQDHFYDGSSGPDAAARSLLGESNRSETETALTLATSIESLVNSNESGPSLGENAGNNRSFVSSVNTLPNSVHTLVAGVDLFEPELINGAREASMVLKNTTQASSNWLDAVAEPSQLIWKHGRHGEWGQIDAIGYLDPTAAYSD